MMDGYSFKFQGGKILLSGFSAEGCRVIADPRGYTAYQFPIQLTKPSRQSSAAPQ